MNSMIAFAFRTAFGLSVFSGFFSRKKPLLGLFGGFTGGTVSFAPFYPLRG